MSRDLTATLAVVAAALVLGGLAWWMGRKASRELADAVDGLDADRRPVLRPDLTDYEAALAAEIRMRRAAWAAYQRSAEQSARRVIAECRRRAAERSWDGGDDR